MRKLVGLVILMAFTVSTVAYAGGVGNCIKPLKETTEFLGIGTAFEYNYVDSRMRDLENSDGPKQMELTDVHQVYGKLIMGLSDHFNLYATIGGIDYDLTFVDRVQSDTLVVDLESGIYTGVGINAYFPFYIDNLYWGADMQASFFFNHVEGITRRNQAATAVDGSFYGLDGQNSLYVAYEIEIETIHTLIIPYVGAYHSWALVGTAESLTYATNATGFVDDEDFQAAYDFASFGVLVGVDVDIAKYFSLNVEGRFVGETAVTTGATFKF